MINILQFPHIQLVLLLFASYAIPVHPHLDRATSSHEPRQEYPSSCLRHYVLGTTNHSRTGYTFYLPL